MCNRVFRFHLVNKNSYLPIAMNQLPDWLKNEFVYKIVSAYFILSQRGGEYEWIIKLSVCPPYLPQ